MERKSKFDPDLLRLSSDFSEKIGVQKAIITIPVRKPNRQEFVQTHPDSSYHLSAAVIELKEERETYLIDPSIMDEVSLEVVPKILITTINRQGVLSLWPIRLPGSDGRIDIWNNSAIEAAQLAKDNWVRVSANMSLGAYDVFKATGNLPEPEWPKMPFTEILEVAFKNQYIDDINHPVLQRLRGES
jgi:hypothetical protein